MKSGENRMSEKITIIIPVYNVEEYLKECLESVLRQTYSDIDIILINDGSTDSSLKICKEFQTKDKRISIYNQENKGLAEVRNKGIELCKTEYFVFVDSDDILEPNFIEQLVLYKNRYQSDIIVASVYRKKKEKLENWRGKIKEYTGEEIIKKIISEKNFYTSACGKLLKKDLFKNIKFPSGRIYEDLSTMYKVYLVTQKKIIIIGEKLYFYRIREGSILNTKFYLQKMDIFKAIEEMKENLNFKYLNELNTLEIESILSFLISIAINDLPYANITNIFKQKLKKNFKNILFNYKINFFKKCLITLYLINDNITIKILKFFKKIRDVKKNEKRSYN